MAEENDKGKRDESDDRTSKKIELSGAQVAGGALASVTAALLGSQLGVAGTVFGAGMTSVIITVGGALYQRSLEKTKTKLENTKDKANAAAARAALKRATSIGAQGLTKLQPPRPPAQRESSASSPADEAATRKIRWYGSAMHWPGGEEVVDDPNATRRIDAQAVADGATARSEGVGADPAESTRHEPAPSGETEVVSPPAPRRGLRWGVLAVTSGLAFVLAMVVITGWEGITGKTLSGDQGTSIGRVVRPGPPPEPQEPAPAETGTSEPSTSSAPEPTSESEPSSESTAPTAPETTGGSTTQQSPTRETGRSTAPRTTGQLPQPSETGRIEVPQQESNPQ
ncbi:MAG: hypothetical protein IJH84_06415 [Saccharopolyspora sp.]|uniref:hypothetical protein n=1 Tax=Saccharopolyspora sp. TaxID=33915 RepID=UPI0025D306D8|nr:hypothetical protein [Saccharopolyspora sp.]MBQ6640651.1 hypothetical protein [Saccharopolyspora sp.]